MSRHSTNRYNEEGRTMPYCEKGNHEVTMTSDVRMPDGRTQDWCCDCYNQSVYEYRAKRKAELAAMPRCEVPDCRRRKTWTVAGGVGLCGQHKKIAERGHQARCAQIGGMALFLPINYNREEMLSLAQTAERR
jgi:hypothetical protein